MNNTTEQEQSAKLPGDVPSMLLPIEGKSLLLPGVAVAEIIHYTQPQLQAEAPDWFLGTISWRSIDIPVVSFELLNGLPASSSRQRHLAVLNCAGTSEQLPFLAIPISGIPRLIRVMQKDITPAQDVEPLPMEKMAVNLGGDTVYLPDVAAIERACLACYTPA